MTIDGIALLLVYLCGVLTVPAVAVLARLWRGSRILRGD